MFTSAPELLAGVDHIRASPRDNGVVEKIVGRPAVGERRELQEALLDVATGLVGDNWLARGFKKSPDGHAHPDMQLNLMNARAIALIARDKERWQLAGDQFYIDLDLSPDNLPPGSRLQLGDAVIEVTAEPHLGCSKFLERFGRDAALFVNSDVGKSLNLRGINAKVIQPGRVTLGAAISKLPRV
jgi:MOSC domain-containing protein YiiM